MLANQWTDRMNIRGIGWPYRKRLDAFHKLLVGTILRGRLAVYETAAQ